MDRWVRCAKSFQTNLIWPSPVPYNGRYSVRPERKEEQEAADLHLFWVRPESEKVHQKPKGAAFRVLREEKTTEIRPTPSSPSGRGNAGSGRDASCIGKNQDSRYIFMYNVACRQIRWSTHYSCRSVGE